MLQETCLAAVHTNLGAKLVDFGGWNMPLHYGSQIEEHHAVRNDAGMFDVSHMTTVDISGSDARNFLRKLLANDVDKLTHTGKALYSGMLNKDGGVIDDLIVYLMPAGAYRLVVNCGTTDKDLAWIEKQAQTFQVAIRVRKDLAMIAVQGPNARAKTHKVLAIPELEILKPFNALLLDTLKKPDWMVAFTGYTGEDGYEIMLPEAQAPAFWSALLEAGVTPCGLGARDTLRLEAGLNLYGHEMDDEVSPLEANMAWTIAWEPADRDFIGREVLEKQRAAGPKHKLVGLVLLDKGVLRAEQEVLVSGCAESGIITSGTYSPTLGVSIALARVPVSIGSECEVLVRNKNLRASVQAPVFVRKGKKVL